MRNEFVYIRDPCRDRARRVITVCPLDRVCLVEKIQMIPASVDDASPAPGPIFAPLPRVA